MNEIAQGAQTLSTYGLYAISVALVAVVIYLYKKVSDLEKELRTTIKQYADDATKQQVTTATEMARLITQTNETLNDNSKAFNSFQETLNDLRMTVQLVLEKLKQ